MKADFNFKLWCLGGGGNMVKKPKVAFVCVHNSCRSQMAEALGKIYASEIFDSYSAGTNIKPEINQEAVDALIKLYGVDMTRTQYPKMVSKLPEDIDVVIKMGCDIACPYLLAKHEEDWGIDDPTGKSEVAFIHTAKTIEGKVRDLARRISNKTINLF